MTQDTYDEINQAVGNTALTDHHPIAYTAFLKLTLHFGVLLMGNIGGGCRRLFVGANGSFGPHFSACDNAYRY